MERRRFSYPEGGPSADLTVEAYGSTLEEAFGNAALAVFNAMTPLEAVEGREARTVSAEAEDLEGLLFDFLDELLFIHDAELLVFSEVEARVDAEKASLSAVCRGERFDPARHRPGIVVKAVTFHQMRIEEGPGGWTIRVVLDT